MLASAAVNDLAAKCWSTRLVLDMTQAKRRERAGLEESNLGFFFCGFRLPRTGPKDNSAQTTSGRLLDVEMLVSIAHERDP